MTSQREMRENGAQSALGTGIRTIGFRPCRQQISLLKWPFASYSDLVTCWAECAIPARGEHCSRCWRP